MLIHINPVLSQFTLENPFLDWLFSRHWTITLTLLHTDLYSSTPNSILLSNILPIEDERHNSQSHLSFTKSLRKQKMKLDHVDSTWSFHQSIIRFTCSVQFYKFCDDASTLAMFISIELFLRQKSSLTCMHRHFHIL